MQETCWIGGYTREFCCDPSHGPQGNPACWDDLFSYDPCCGNSGIPQQETARGVVSPTEFDAELLESMLGPKLDRTLAENESSLADLERDLRREASSPENRTMAESMARAFLALVLHRQGRDEEASIEMRRGFLMDGLNISKNGAWIGANAAGYHMHDKPFADALVKFFQTRHARTVVDFGCGLGLYVRDLRAAGIRAGGFDGNPSTVQISEGRCLHADLSSKLDLGTRWAWVLSLEVAEHIPREFEQTFLDNVDQHACAGLVLSWGNQAGEGHVNVRPSSEVVELFKSRGFRLSEESTEHLRQAATLPWLQSTVLVLERDPVLGFFSGCVVA